MYHVSNETNGMLVLVPQSPNECFDPFLIIQQFILSSLEAIKAHSYLKT